MPVSAPPGARWGRRRAPAAPSAQLAVGHPHATRLRARRVGVPPLRGANARHRSL